MVQITFLGAGSTVFARQLMTDILLVEGLDEGCFALVDIDPVRLDLAQQIAERLIAHSSKHWSVRASTERRDVLAGSDFLINTIEVAGLANVRHDFDLPMKYGINQCIGDTIGPGGIFKALRTGPAWLDILRDAEQLCPDAWVLNYTNPMSILTLAALTGTSMRTVGLCHSVQATSKRLAEYLDVPYAELEWRCAGINHNAWFTQLRHHGHDLYPRLRQRAQVAELYEQDPVRFEVMLHFGAFVTESSGHFSEYVPYFRKRPEFIERYCRDGYLGGTGFYADNWPTWRANNDASIRDMLAGTRELPFARTTGGAQSQSHGNTRAHVRGTAAAQQRSGTLCAAPGPVERGRLLTSGDRRALRRHVGGGTRVSPTLRLKRADSKREEKPLARTLDSSRAYVTCSTRHVTTGHATGIPRGRSQRAVCETTSTG